MDKFWMFRYLLDFMADRCEVTDADMNYCGNCILIQGVNDEKIITIEVSIKDKEENNGN